MLCFRKLFRTNDDIRHLFPRRNNSSFVDSLVLIVQIKKSNRNGIRFHIHECGPPMTLLWKTWVEKSVRAYLNGQKHPPWIRHSDLAGIIVLSLANTQHDFKYRTLAENKGIFSHPVRFFYTPTEK
ncbi:hypothetical protein AVEN_94846-1 [Araneus ventricosus]|uniref:Uncharacterized protein n=1 Tax=Araneus ventricosus TaxID=182803 RepID=A0A4Y2CPB1_ARAVE|nr:hypothetical protein AVEN_94846-1 [Araneus ventricosus]